MVEAKQTWGRRTSAKRRQIRERVLLVAAAILVVAGIVAFVQSRTSEGTPPTTLTPAQKKASAQQQPALKPHGKLDPAARRTAITFIRTALAREDLAKAWNLATPDLRGGLTKKQWVQGNLPFPPFPVDNLETTGFNVAGVSPKEILLEVLLVPEPNSGYVPTRYEITLERTSAKHPWRVSYFLPYAPPGMYTEPK